MAGNDKSYLEIKVTFIHIFTLLVAIILIGIFLFYLGYQAGKAAVRNQFNLGETADSGQTEKVEVVTPPPEGRDKTGSTIDTELDLHRREDARQVQSKPLKKEAYYSIQVGAYADFANARRESDKFSKMGYPSEILSVVLQKKKLFRVRVGRFTNREEADKEREKLERTEKRKFRVIKSD